MPDQDQSWVGFSVAHPSRSEQSAIAEGRPLRAGFFEVTVDPRFHNITVNDVATGSHILIPFGAAEELAAAIVTARRSA